MLISLSRYLSCYFSPFPTPHTLHLSCLLHLICAFPLFHYSQDNYRRLRTQWKDPPPSTLGAATNRNSNPQYHSFTGSCTLSLSPLQQSIYIYIYKSKNKKERRQRKIEKEEEHEMSQCVPSWDLDDPPNPPTHLPFNHLPSPAPLVPMSVPFDFSIYLFIYLLNLSSFLRSRPT